MTLYSNPRKQGPPPAPVALPMAAGGTVLVIEETATTRSAPAAQEEEDRPPISRPSTTNECYSPGAGGRESPAGAYERLDAEEDSRLRAFKQGESLGKGAYGEVFRAMVAGRFMAVKKIPLDLSLNVKAAEKEINTLLLEINTLKRLRHPRIVRYHGCIRQDSEEDPALLIFLEYMPSGSIKGVLTKFGPYGVGLVRKYTRQICEGLDFLHSEKIVHRDVKGANILIDTQGDAKLADFGACRELEALQNTVTGGLRSIHGSVFWMAPEVMKYKAGRRSDIWSLGCTVIEMITAEPPWGNLRVERLTVTDTLKRIVDSEEGPPLPEKIHHHCQSFLQQTLIRDHTKRPYTDKLLKHIFLQDAGGSSTSVGAPKGAHEAWTSQPAPSLAPTPELLS